jgi:hypothetical protein
MPEEPEIPLEQLDLYRCCRFVHRVFAPYPCLRSIEPMGDGPFQGHRMWKPYRGQDYDPEEFELVEGGWDHEHCHLCGAHIDDGDSYWANEDEDWGLVDLCAKCYSDAIGLLARTDPGPDGAGSSSR